jgi:hypothetical protein
MAKCRVREEIADKVQAFMSNIIFLLRYRMMLSTIQKLSASPAAVDTTAPTQLAMKQEFISHDKRFRSHS